MSSTNRTWTTAGFSESAYAALASGLRASEVWSLLLSALERRARQRTPAAVMQQWESDRFVQPAYVDQRVLNRLDSRLLAAAQNFEALELSPLAPLAACSSVALTSQNRVVSTIRGTEVVSDPTNVLALESARRLRKDPRRVVRLATSHRCVRAQEVPKRPGFAAHFRIFCLTTAGHELGDQAFVTDALLEHINVHIGALNSLEEDGYAFANRKLRLLASPARVFLAERIASMLEGEPVTIEPLEHGYYDGLRFMISARSDSGDDIPLIDGGAFDWLTRLAANRKLAFVASAIGSQLVPHAFRSPAHG